MKKIWIPIMIIAVPLLIAALIFATMGLWNWLVPVLFAGPVITFWQTAGLLLLSKILFGGFHGKRCGPGNHMRDRWRNRWEEKMKHMSPEQREELRKKWKARCGTGWGYREESSSEAAGSGVSGNV